MISRTNNSQATTTTPNSSTKTQATAPMTTENEPDKEIDQTTEESKTPVHWLHKNYVQTKALPLTERLLEEEVIYETTKGNQTILDWRYAAYRVGSLLSDLGFSAEDIGSEALQSFIDTAINYFQNEYEKDRLEIEQEKAQKNQQELIAKVIPNLKKIALAMGQRYKLDWTDEQWIAELTKGQ